MPKECGELKYVERITGTPPNQKSQWLPTCEGAECPEEMWEDTGGGGARKWNKVAPKCLYATGGKLVSGKFEPEPTLASRCLCVIRECKATMETGPDGKVTKMECARACETKIYKDKSDLRPKPTACILIIDHTEGKNELKCVCVLE